MPPSRPTGCPQNHEMRIAAFAQCREDPKRPWIRLLRRHAADHADAKRAVGYRPAHSPGEARIGASRRARRGVAQDDRSRAECAQFGRGRLRDDDDLRVVRVARAVFDPSPLRVVDDRDRPGAAKPQRLALRCGQKVAENAGVSTFGNRPALCDERIVDRCSRFDPDEIDAGRRFPGDGAGSQYDEA